jgi:hypothetical protein
MEQLPQKWGLLSKKTHKTQENLFTMICLLSNKSIVEKIKSTTWGEN